MSRLALGLGLGLSRGGGTPVDYAWGAVTRLFGARTNQPSEAPIMETWLGRSLDMVTAFANGTDWASLIGYATTEATRGASHPIEWSIGFPPGVTLAQVASGSQDIYFRQLATIAKNARPSDIRIPIRPMWEFQLTKMPWCAVGKEAEYIEAFRHIANLFRTIDSRFRMVWCPNFPFMEDGSKYDPEIAYPGDAYVDVVAMDFYYIALFDGPDINLAWQNKMNTDYSLNWLVAFGRLHNKPIAIPEWGVNANNLELYISAMAEFIARNNVAYANYYNENTPDPMFQCRLDDDAYPTTGARFKKEFGPSVPVNLLPNPSDLSSASYGKFNATISEGHPGPLGALTAEAILETVSDAEHIVNITTVKAAAALRYRITMEAKGLGRDYGRIAVFQNSFSSGAICFFNLFTRQVSNNFTYGEMTDIEPFAIPIEDGFGIFGFEFTSSTGTDLLQHFQPTLVPETVSYVGDITKGLIVSKVSLRRFA